MIKLRKIRFLEEWKYFFIESEGHQEVRERHCLHVSTVQGLIVECGQNLDQYLRFQSVLCYHEPRKNVDREIFKHRRRRDLNFKSNGLGLSKIVRTEVENGRFEVLNLSALWCSSGACVSVVNSSILYFLGRENRLSKPNRPWVSCSRIPRPRKRACFGQNREGHP